MFSSLEVEVLYSWLWVKRCVSPGTKNTANNPPESARDWLAQNWFSPQSSSYDMFCRAPDHTGGGGERRTFNRCYLLAVGLGAHCLDAAGSRQCLFIPSFYFLFFFGTVAFSGDEAPVQYVVGTSTVRRDTQL